MSTRISSLYAVGSLINNYVSCQTSFNFVYKVTHMTPKRIQNYSHAKLVHYNLFILREN